MSALLHLAGGCPAAATQGRRAAGAPAAPRRGAAAAARATPRWRQAQVSVIERAPADASTNGNGNGAVAQQPPPAFANGNGGAAAAAAPPAELLNDQFAAALAAALSRGGEVPAGGGGGEERVAPIKHVEEMLVTALNSSRGSIRRLMQRQSELEAEISKEEKQAQRLEWLLHRVRADYAYFTALDSMNSD